MATKNHLNHINLQFVFFSVSAVRNFFWCSFSKVLNFGKARSPIFFGFLILLQSGCSDDTSKLFTSLNSSRTGIHFKNILKEDENSNVLNYAYFYNGAGVAVGDINNDGLPDILFTGNMVANRLYLNKGNFEFED